MRKWFIGLAIVLAGHSFGAAAELAPIEVLSGIASEARYLLSAVFTAENQRPITVDDLKLATPSDPKLQSRLADLYRRNLDGNPPGETITFTRWPQLFVQYASDLLVKWDTGASQKSLQDAFYSVHLGYTRSIVAAYTALEIHKRRYVMIHDPADTAQSRWVTRNLLEAIHTTAQRCLRWMHTARFDRRFKSVSVDSPYNPGPWETKWAGNFFYDSTPTVKAYERWANPISLDQFLAAAETARPGFPDIGPIAPTPGTNPAPTTPVPVTPTPQPVPRPADTATRDRVLRVVERLYALLEKPEIAGSDEMRRLLEELIDQLKQTLN